MAAGHFTFEVPVNGTWRYDTYIRRAVPSRQAPDRRVAIDLTGYDAKLQARRKAGDPVLMTISTRTADDPDALIPPLDEEGRISWTLNIAPLNLAPGNLRYDLILIDPDGNPDPVIEGQIQLTTGITQP